MSSDGEDENIFEVERILAEQTNQDGDRVFLIKWKGYQDAECTWEPAENFMQNEVLQDWEIQKADGDLLEGKDLERIQEMMDRFQLEQAEKQQDRDEESPETDDGKDGYKGKAWRSRSLSSPSLLSETEERPAKRAKLVPDAPLLAKKKKLNPRLVKDINGRRVPETSKANQFTRKSKSAQAQTLDARQEATTPSHQPDKTSKTVPESDSGPLHKTTVKQSPFLRSATLPSSSSLKLTTLTSAPEQRDNATSSIKPFEMAKTSRQHPPQRFFAPETHQHTRASNLAAITNRDRAGQRFRNARHMNNAWKQQRDDIVQDAAPGLTFTPGEVLPSSSSTRSPTIMGVPNKSFLFFDTDEDEDTVGHVVTRPIGAPQTDSDKSIQEVAVAAGDHRITDNVGKHMPILSTTKVEQVEPTRTQIDATVSFDASQCENLPSYQTELPADSLPVSENSAQASYIPSPAVSRTTQPSIVSAQTGSPSTMSLTAEKSIAQNESEPIQPPHRSSLFNKSLSFSKSETTVAPTEQWLRRSSSPQKAPPVRPLLVDELQPYSQVRSGIPTTNASNYLSQAPPEDIVRASNGREWRKCDLILDLYVNDSEAGDVRILHVPWEYCKPIVGLKERAKIPIHFNQPITRGQYNELIQHRWFSYLAIGSIEAFDDTLSSISSLADYMERQDIAFLWQHPKEDLMMLLYSCRNTSWQDLPWKPIRQGEARLQIAFRRKLNGPEHRQESPEQLIGGSGLKGDKAQEASEPLRETIDSRDQERRVRRRRSSMVLSTVPHQNLIEASIAPEQSLQSTEYGQPPQSPGAQLVNELQMKMPPQYDDTVSNGGRMTGALVEPSIERSGEVVHSRSPTIADHTHTTDPRKTVKVVPSKAHEKISYDMQTKTTNRTVFPGLAREVKDFAQIPHMKGVDVSQVYIMLLYRDVDPTRIQELRQWLASKGLAPDRIFDNSKSGAWADFSRHVHDSVCVALFDKMFPPTSLDGLAKRLENNNLVCWDIDFQSPAREPLPMTRLFPRGTVMQIPESCLVREPEDTLVVLNWFQKKAVQKHSACKLMLAPNAGIILQEQMILAQEDSTKKTFQSMASTINAMVTDSHFSSNANDLTLSGTDTLEFSVIELGWSDVYKNIPEHDERLTRVEQNRRDDEKDERLLQYFAAWAAQHMHNHRRFITFTVHERIKGARQANTEHVRLQLVRGFAATIRKADKKAQEKETSSDDRRSESKSRTRAISIGSVPRSQA